MIMIFYECTKEECRWKTGANRCGDPIRQTVLCGHAKLVVEKERILYWLEQRNRYFGGI